MSSKGHGECVNYLNSFNIPMIVLGGGGYTIDNVAKCWTHETAVLLREELDNKIPNNQYFNEFSDKKLYIKVNLIIF